ncbi:MAG: ACP S-malonyltransferase [Chloroflexi bacterium]|nr:ACP S-malonyltransferase [Chloroflexota bacterium]
MLLRPENSAVNTSLAYLFPGQGSQAVGIGLQLYQQSPSAKAVLQEVDEALKTPLTKIMFEGPEEELKNTINAQPAILAVSLACVRAMEETLGPGGVSHPCLLAGHSLGEYTALAVSGVLNISDTARLVRERGRLMQEACEKKPGIMAAVLGLDEITLEEICRQTNTYISNINSDDQIVISGERVAMVRALDMATARGAKRVIPLQVSGAFHSSLMEPAREGLVEAISSLEFQDPQIPIVANCTGQPLTTARSIKEELISQICSCVQWKRSIKYMVSSGVSSFLEVGPGKVLSGLVKRINQDARVASVSDMTSILSLSSL